MTKEDIEEAMIMLKLGATICTLSPSYDPIKWYWKILDGQLLITHDLTLPFTLHNVSNQKVPITLEYLDRVFANDKLVHLDSESKQHD